MTKKKTDNIENAIEEIRLEASKHYHDHHNLKVKFKKLHKNAVLPTYAHPSDAGMDCYAVDGPDVAESYIRYNLGFAMEIPEGYVGLMFPRSSVSKKDLMLANAVGVIDSGYRGEVQARFKHIISEQIVNKAPLNANRSDYVLQYDNYKPGDAVCQLIIIPIPTISTEWVDELSDTERGDGGFGSTN